MTIALKDGGTTATTGGTDQDFDRTPTPVNNGYEYADVSEPDFFARQKVVLTARAPQLQSDGSWSKQKISARFVMPITRADGTIAYNVARHEVEYDPESSSANLAELREFSAQMAIGTAFDDLHVAGTLPA
jgi:hypothetical protein